LAKPSKADRSAALPSREEVVSFITQAQGKVGKREIAQRFGGGKVADALRPRPFTQDDGNQGTELYIDPSRFGSVFAADVPALRPRAWPARIVR